jgi:hypothetical protein
LQCNFPKCASQSSSLGELLVLVLFSMVSLVVWRIVQKDLDYFMLPFLIHLSFPGEN